MKWSYTSFSDMAFMTDVLSFFIDLEKVDDSHVLSDFIPFLVHACNTTV